MAFNFAVYVNTGEFDQMMVDVANAIPVGKEASYPSALKGTKEILENTTSRYNSQTSIATNSDNSQIIRSAVINLISGKTTAEIYSRNTKCRKIIQFNFIRLHVQMKPYLFSIMERGKLSETK